MMRFERVMVIGAIVLALAVGLVESGDSEPPSCSLCDLLEGANKTASQCQANQDNNLFASQLETQLKNINKLLKGEPNDTIKKALDYIGSDLLNFLKAVLTCNNPPLSGLTEQIKALLKILSPFGVDLSSLNLSSLGL